MSQERELDELREFNDKVSKGRGIIDHTGTQADVPEQPIRVGPGHEPVTSSLAGKAKLWAIGGDNYFPCEEAIKSLPPGHYVVDCNPQQGIYFKRRNFSIDDLIQLPDNASESVISEIQKFWTLENHFRDFGFLWKRGMMLWGPPGSGKTSTLQIVAQQIIDNGGIAVSIFYPSLAADGLHLLRKIEPKRPVIALLEDVDAIIAKHGESELLALLDGEHQIDNVVYIATTNYPERLDPRFINRPSRFDVIKKIGMPGIEARKVYLSTKSKALAKDRKSLEKWVIDTEGFSVAHLKELIISVEVFQSNYDESLARLKTMMDLDCSSNDYDTKEMGFTVRKAQSHLLQQVVGQWNLDDFKPDPA